MIHKAVTMMYLNRQEDDLFMDTPISTSSEDLIKQTKDEKKWEKTVLGIKDTICIRSKEEKAQDEENKNEGGLKLKDRLGGDDER